MFGSLFVPSIKGKIRHTRTRKPPRLLDFRPFSIPSKMTLSHIGRSPPSSSSSVDMDRDFEAEVVPKFIKHSNLWFQDGNIILQTTSPSEDEIHLFRCHKSVLSKHSTIFAKMFEVESFVCVRRSEEYDGVPVISIPDASADVDALLNMLYDPL